MAKLKRQKRELIQEAFRSGNYSPHTITDEDIIEICLVGKLDSFPSMAGRSRARRAKRDQDNKIRKKLGEVVSVIGTDVIVDLDRLFGGDTRSGIGARKTKSSMNSATRGTKSM